MRTTLELPDDLFRRMKAKAALQGLTLQELLTQCVLVGLQSPTEAEVSPRQRSKLPVTRRRGKGVIPSLTPELQSKLEEEDDLAKLGRSFACRGYRKP